MTKERALQDRLFRHLQKSNKTVTRFDTIVPNVKLYKWESDLLFLGRNDTVYEFEIKTSISDLRADFKNKIKKHNAMRLRAGQTPNYFYMVIPHEILEKADIPNYYGVILYNDSSIKTYRHATQMHTTKIKVYDKLKLAKALYYKYWKERLDDGEIFNIRNNKGRKH